MMCKRCWQVNKPNKRGKNIFQSGKKIFLKARKMQTYFKEIDSSFSSGCFVTEGCANIKVP